MTNGIIYIATGSEYVEEAHISARSVKRHNNYPIAIITDEKSRIDRSVFDRVILAEKTQNGFLDQIKNMEKTPFDRTICLDTDIFIDGDITEVFEILDQFDMAASHDPDKFSTKLDDIPNSFPEYNTGVIAYRSGNNFNEFISNWWEEYHSTKKSARGENQPSFRKALYFSQIRIATLPSEYNLMVRFPGKAYGKVKIFHGRLKDLEGSGGAAKYINVENAAKDINSKFEHRVFVPRFGIKLYTRSNIYDLRRTLGEHGILWTIKRAISKFLK